MVARFSAPLVAALVAAQAREAQAAPPPAPAETSAAPSEVPATTTTAATPAAKGAPAPTDTAPAPAPVTVTVRGEGPPKSASEVVIKRDVLAAAPHRTASDMLLLVPGVFITQHSGQGKAHQIFLRGFDAVHGQDVEIWAGGAPVNEVSNLHGQGYADLHFIMPEVVREVRATLGTYDVRQGDFAVAGSVAFELGYAEPGVTAALTLGSFGERRAFLAYHPANAPEESFAAFEVESTDGFGPSRAARRASAIGQWVVPLGASTRARVTASAYSARFDSAGVLRLDDIDQGRVDRFATYDPRQGGDSSRAQLVMAIEGSDEETRARFSFAPYLVARSLRLRSDFTGFLEDPVNGDSDQQINEALTVGATGSYRRTLALLAEDDALEGGISLRNDWITQSQRRLSVVTDRVTKTLVDAGVRATDVAGYVDLSLHPRFITPRLVLRGGVRVDGLAYATQDRLLDGHAEGAGAARAAMGAHVGGKATADVVLLPGLHAIASYGDGFRSPQARELGDGERTPFTTVRSFEGGLRYAEGSRIRASAAAFYTTLSDDLAFDPASTRFERIPATQRAGFSAALALRPRAWVTESASVTFTRASFTGSDATYTKGSLVPYAPEIVARADVALTPAVGRVWGRELRGHAGTGLTFMGVRPLPYAETGHDVFLADASLGLRLKEVELRAEVTNLLDARWYDGEFTFASNFTRGATPALVPSRHVTVGAPRTLFVTLSIHL